MRFFRLPGRAAGAIALAGTYPSGRADNKTPSVTQVVLHPDREEDRSSATAASDEQAEPSSSKRKQPEPPFDAVDEGAQPPHLPARERADSLGFSPFRHISTTYRIRSARPHKTEYGLLPSDEENGGGKDVDDLGHDTYYVNEDTVVSQDPLVLLSGRRHLRRRWVVCSMLCGLSLLAVLLVLNVLLFASRAAYAAEPDSNNIFSSWGLVGSGTDDLAWYPTDFLRDVVPVRCHSHNDYWRKVPLFSALRVGCVGTEADVWLVGDDLLVGHERAALTANRTFRSLYVDPLVKILDHANPDTVLGSQDESKNQTVARGVFDMSPNQTLALLVDVKTDGAATFRKVLEQVEPLRQRGWLSTFENGHVRYGPVTLVGSGNTPFDVVVENGTYRFAFFDAPVDGLENSVFDQTNSYYASASLEHAVGRVWFGLLRGGQLRQLRYQVQQAHARGLQSRYWDLPAWPVSMRNAIWNLLVSESVDLLNVDDITAAARGDWTKTKISLI